MKIYCTRICFLLSILLISLSFACGKPVKTVNVESVKENEELAAEKLAEEKYLQEKLHAEKVDNAIKSYLEEMTPYERIAQLFLVNLEGNESFTPIEYVDGKALIPGGYIFFSFNIASSASTINSFTNSIKDYCLKNNIAIPYLSIDQEGGLVNRLRGITSSVPSNRTIASKYSVKEAYDLYSLQAKQMSMLGFNLNLAPVAEVENETNREFLTSRSYGNKENVLNYATASISAYQDNFVGTVLKHFPGNTNTDPHTGLPEIKCTLAELEDEVIEPFSKLIEKNPAGILMSHARIDVDGLDGDSKNPACLSSYWVTEMLRNKLSYEGLIFSDDIFMAALEKNGYPPEKAVVMAIDAGIDCIMLSEKKFADVVKILYDKAAEDTVFADKLLKSESRVIKYKMSSMILFYNEITDKIEPLEKSVAENWDNTFLSLKTEGDTLVK